ncbi:hypothetical protein SERLA73DRAFT_136371 [Serpula lacrymans var. lacrymans S7.3]|uniref:DUF6593 domain-containing protein n=2 Tax=Serpula lacrymans var. lacrymans TaxID=341189 RepID=F8PUR9_SERL3|nr:uncharacterized protein SERLADRAFT_448914 [Serpula lacrymans var. lacrymans S7.9]EGO00477.1 hypothetical protein SERLA73DRAFT_136371 [Serpula lacrymans var. lacrymans S7.3]EGO26029.1 hypothetical protein SERLADRAFT_448914 [Serpula lacrymans var. lacrymans S7.9]
MTHYGMPYLLEDKTGELSGSDFNDLNDRMCLRLRCTARESTHTAYMIFDITHHSDGLQKPLAALDFGPNESLGTISYSSGSQIPMKDYLMKLSTFGSSKARKFVGSDGQEYRWNWRITKDQEWTCTNSSGYTVADYSLKLPGEPEYVSSSGCMFTIDEAFPHLAAEFLASLTIMRHIVAHSL